jgi:metallophosphoesterase (TIGR00282 family)
VVKPSSSVRILVFGDIVGNPGLKALEAGLEAWSDKNIDAIIVNGENLAGGSGISRKSFRKITESYGVALVTMGNHWNKNRDVYELKNSQKIVLPGNAWNVDDFRSGFQTFRTKGDVQIAVCNAMGKAFMYGENRCFFKYADKVEQELGQSCKIRIFDFHAEATSEKQALGHYLAERWSLVYGTHTHVPTADDRILNSWTGYVSDVGMTGSYDSVIGMEKQSAIQMLRGEKKPSKRKLGQLDLWANAVLTDIDAESGKCINIERLQRRF